ncbi:molybdenum cofactor guanylyltransferase MobA [Bordetella sp. FB-8]|uniref:molybdenum cofactor guanylyltransferase MobA n=1 Tax=Bordetella sp. FB-8 TaxID=1159870 RepID=UPI00036D6A7D|nr:molybdenum cofactor guanylyltransferase MobA [Bordetella sp. FB-8]
MADTLAESAAGLILAGGRGIRMRQADKGLLVLAGQPLVALVARRLAPQVRSLFISANRNAAFYEQYGKVLPDDPAFDAWSGPLAGVAAGLRAWSGPWLVVAPCDTPFLPPDLAARLIGAAQAQGAPLAVACAGGRRHSVCMALRTALADDLYDYLRAGDRKVDLWQARVGGVEVGFDDACQAGAPRADARRANAPRAFLNINTPEDLTAAEQSMDSQQ